MFPDKFRVQPCMSISIIHNVEKLTIKVTSKTVPMKKEKKEKEKKTATERKRDTQEYL